MGTLTRMFALSALACALVAHADDATDRLVEQAEFWDARGRNDLAEQAWQRVLQVDGNNVRALERLYEIERDAGNASSASTYRRRLLELAPTSEVLGGGSAAQQRQTDNQVSRARRLSQSGQTEDALRAYRDAFAPATEPPPALALEYYETLAGSSEGWAQARDALDRLRQSNPGSPRYELVYARVLTYRAGSRRDGIALLESLTKTPAVSADARAAQRQALLWLNARPSDRAAYRAYLEGVGTDAEIAAKLDQIDAGERARQQAVIAAARGEEIDAAYAALNAGELETAEIRFQRILSSNPRSADAEAGLGLLRLRQSQFAEAAERLGRAVQWRPAMRADLSEALSTARFWSTVESARASYQARQTDTAATQFDAAFKVVPPKSADASAVAEYTGVLLELERTRVAEQLLQAAMVGRSDDPQLRMAMARVLVAQGRVAEADRLLNQLSANTGEGLDDAAVRDMRVQLLRAQADTARAAGDRPKLESALRQALALAPNDPWIRLELSRIYRQQGRTADADALLAALDTSGDNPDSVLARALALTESARWYDALLTLEQLPANKRNADTRRIQRDAWVRYQLERAQSAAAAGDGGQAMTLLGQVQQVTQGSNDYAVQTALVWRALGDTARALATLRRAFAQNVPTADESLAYAGLLLGMDQGAEFEAVAEGLLRGGKLNAAQSAQLEDMIVGYRIKLADTYRQDGNLAAAYQQLREVLLRYPTQHRVQLALMRLLVSAGDTDRALELAESLMSYASDEREVRLAAIDVALAAQDTNLAEDWLRPLLRERDPDPAVIKTSARLAQTRGRTAESMQLLERAAVLEQQLAVETSFPNLTLLDPESGAPVTLPELIHQMIQGPDQPVGPLLPRAGDNGPYAGANPFAAGGYRLSTRLGGASPKQIAQAQAGNSGTDGVALRLDNGFSAPRSSRRGSGAQERIVISDPELNEQLTQMRADISPWVAGSFGVRSRRGESGLSKLTALELPIDVASTEWNAGRIGLRIKPVSLDAGIVSGSNLLRFGTLALINGEADELEQSADGTAIAVGYSVGKLDLEIGTTPLGFPVENVVGAIHWAPTIGESLRLDATFLREALTDSLLSYAGAYDPLTGRDWGGVLRTGARLDVAYDFNRYGVYVNGGYYGLGGRNVDENTQYELGGGLFFRVLQTRNSQLTLGLNLTSFAYENNLRHFTFGHGGYFSPQFFAALTVPMSWSGTFGRLSYSTDLAIGVQSFREDGAPLFPGRPSLQEELEAVAEFEPTADIPLGYSSQSSSGLGYKLGGEAQYRMTEHLDVGGRLSLDNARDYEETVVQLYIRYRFHGRNYDGPEFDIDAPSLTGGPLR